MNDDRQSAAVVLGLGVVLSLVVWALAFVGFLSLLQ